MLFRITFAAILAVTCAQTAISAEKTVAESARDIPVAYDVDVVVVGGSSGAVAAAAEAANQGADVFLAAPRTYLGEDLCGTYRLWLNPGEEPASELEEALFEEPPAPMWLGEGLPFTYEADLLSAGKHQDTNPPSMLCDGKWQSAYNQSVEYPGDVNVVLDLGEPQALGEIHILAFQRNRDIEVKSLDIALSTDKQTWTPAGTIQNEMLGQGEYIDEPLYLATPLEGTARYVRVIAHKSERVKRLLLAEIVVEATGDTTTSKYKTDARVPPKPMQVKRTLDQTLLDAGVTFLFGCYPTDVLRDADGALAGIVMANRAGRQAVRAKVIIDATPRAAVARMAGTRFARYPGGEQTFTRIVVGGDAPEAEGVGVRTMPSPVQVARTGKRGTGFHLAYECTLTFPMGNASYASFAQAELKARDLTWTSGQVGSSEFLFQVPPDAMRGAQRLKGTWPGAEAADLAAFRPAKTSGLYVLGGCADVSRDAAAALLRPLQFLRLGTRVGRAAAEDAEVHLKPRVVCFGDSITAAAYPTKLAGMLKGYRVINAGIGGNTSAQGLARLDADVLEHNPQAVVVLFGTNDSVLNGPGKYRVPVGEYEKNLRAIATKCQANGARVIFMTPPPIMDAPYYTRHPKEYYELDGGLQMILTRYREAVKRVAAEVKAPVIELEKSLAANRSVLAECGVHPNAQGERIMAECAARALDPLLPAKDSLAPQGVHVACETGKASVKGDTREMLVGLRSFQRGLATIPAEACTTPVIAEYDVVVVGGGTGGAPAGIGAARAGAKTLVIEYQYGLGGVGTLGLIGKYYYGYRAGFTGEIDMGVANMGEMKTDEPAHGWNVEWKMEWLRQALCTGGADIWFGTLGCGAVIDGDKVAGVVVATPHGRGIVLAKTVIDSTGNSDIAAAAGATCIYTDASHVAVQGTGLPPRQPGAGYTNTDYTLTDDGDVVDVWRSFVAARVKYRKAFDLGQVIDTRERRRIVGDFVISPLDIFNGRTYPDSVGKSHSNFDTHGFTIHPLFSLNAPDKIGIDAFTPYRALLPKGLDDILVTGLGISAHRDSMPILRMQPDIQ
ncbi:MAG: FAD-dependent oxidoreductase, partial [bacterium]|nr:FAD-dependent oxidoreductase [bacterium]